MKSHIIKPVNICVRHAIQCSHVLGGKTIQFEFSFCEQMPENLVKNLLANAKLIDVNNISYENSPVMPHSIHRSGCDLFDRKGRDERLDC